MSFESSEALFQLQHFLHQSIPMTKAMKLTLDKCNENKIQTSAPLAENINDKGSLFGGSSSSLMIISAWSLIKYNCLKHNIDADIVIHKNSCHWHKALFHDLIIKAWFKQDQDFVHILDKINTNKHHRIDCKITLVDKEGVLYSTMKANYVIIPKK